MWFAYLSIAVVIQFFSIVAISSATSFGCKNGMISDDWRQKVLSFHNTNRRTVSQGNQATKDKAKMPVAKDLTDLTWDCNLEGLASSYICGKTAIPTGNTYGIISAAITLSGDSCDIYVQKTKPVLQDWWNEAKAVDLSTDVKYDEATIKEFGIMVNKDATGFACTYDKCSSGAQLLCVYDKKPAANADLYTKGTAASDVCSVCANAATCKNFLCSPTYDSSATLPDDKCTNKGDDGMTLDLQNMAVNMHNYYRRQLATGWGSQMSGYAPTAKQMNLLKYDCDNLGKDTKDNKLVCGTQDYATINYHKVKNLTATPEDVLKEGIMKWFEQLELVNLDKTATYTSDVATKASKFAHLAVGGATQVGCSALVCDKEGYVIAGCQYDQDPVEDDALYTPGNTCAGCAGAKCENGAYTALCV
ncbi:hypothetical protein RB195_005567 [Necator americanus]|uniref:SCP domain-containing protein n=1 Tax=Necator americanus TaxID=51031 RepID=A0ABR1BRH4_NECAM